MTRLELVRRAILAELSPLQKSLATAAVVGIPTALRFFLGVSANPVPFVTYFPAVLLGAVFLGWRWAALATLLAMVIVNRVFLSAPWLSHPAPPDIAILAFFCGSCAILVLTGDTLRRTVGEMDTLSKQRALLSQEMHHRVQNTLSVAMALVRVSKAKELDEFRGDLLGRLTALANANRILERGPSGEVDIETIVRDVTAPFGDSDAIKMSGGSRSLSAQDAHYLTLILHELCTNALKHGALSRETGYVTLHWTPEPEPLRLDWQERGGPPVSSPQRKGLGARLFAGQTRFLVTIDYERAGLRCSIDAR